MGRSGRIIGRFENRLRMQKRVYSVFDILVATASYAAIIVIGAACSHTGFIAAETKNVFSRILFYITLPATVVYSFVGFQFDESLLMVSAVALGVTVCGFLGTVLYTLGRPPQTRAFHTLLGYGYNIGCFALPFISAQYGAAGVVVASMFDLGNCFMVSGGGYALTRAFILKKNTGGVISSLFRTLFKTPALDCYVVLILLAVVTGFSVPEQVGTFLEPIAHANGFLAMFMIGLALEWRIDRARMKEVLKCIAWRVTLSLAFCALVYFFVPLAPDIKAVTIVCLLSPIMSVGLIYVMWIEGDSEMAGFAISVSVVVSLVLMTAATVLLS